MGVDLGVIRAAGVLTEHGGDQAARVGIVPPCPGPDPGRGRVRLQVLEDGGDGGVVRREPARVAGEGPHDRHGLGRGERGIEPDHRPHHPTISEDPIGKPASEPCTGSGVTALQHGHQVLALDLPFQSQPSCGVTNPDTRLLPRPHVVLGEIRGDGPRRVPARPGPGRCAPVDRGHP